jgi:hypothetical protein
LQFLGARLSSFGVVVWISRHKILLQVRWSIYHPVLKGMPYRHCCKLC